MSVLHERVAPLRACVNESHAGPCMHTWVEESLQTRSVPTLVSVQRTSHSGALPTSRQPSACTACLTTSQHGVSDEQRWCDMHCHCMRGTERQCMCCSKPLGDEHSSAHATQLPFLNLPKCVAQQSLVPVPKAMGSFPPAGAHTHRSDSARD